MPHPPPPHLQPILNGMLSLIQTLATAPASDADKLDRYLAQISQLPVIRSVLEAEEGDREGDGRESEVAIFSPRMDGGGLVMWLRLV